MDRRVDLAVARLEVDALARSYGLTRSTRFINVLDASGISKTQKDTGVPAADGGGFDIAFEVPIYDFGRAKTREAEQRYLEALNTLAADGGQCTLGSARGLWRLHSRPAPSPLKYEREVLPLRKTISEQTELQYNAMQVDAFALLEAARAKRCGAKWRASRPSGISGSPRPISASAVLGGGSLSSVDSHPRRPRDAASE